MSIVKRTKGSYVITTVGASSNVDITTNTLTITGNLTTTGNVDFPGADINANSVTTTDIFANGNITAGGAVTAAGNITGAVFIGDGSGLTGVPAGNALGNIISFGTSQVAVPQISGPVFVNVAGVSNVAVFNSDGANITGNLRTGNILSGGFFFANGQPLTGSVKYDATPVAPIGPNPGDFWFNTVNGILYQYNDDGDTDQWVDSSGIGTPPSTTSVLANTVIQRDANGSATANVWQGSAVLVTGNVVSTGGFIQGAQAIVAGNIVAGGTIQAPQTVIAGNVVAGGFFVGNGAALTGLPGGFSNAAAVAYAESGWAGNIIPSANVTYNLGNTTNRWNDIWLANSTIHLGAANISAVGANLVLPATVQIGTAVLDARSGNLALPENISATTVTTTTVAANTISANALSVAGNTATITTANLSIGYLDIPQVALTSNTTLNITSAGKHFYSTTAGNLTLTLPGNASVPFPVGTAVSVIVQAVGNVNVNAAAGVTLYLAGNSTTGNRVVTSYGMATVMKVASNTWFITGAGVR